MKQEVNLIRARLKTASWGYGREAAIRRNRRLLSSKANLPVALHLNRRQWPFTASKSWIASERSLRFKYRVTSAPRDLAKIAAHMKGFTRNSTVIIACKWSVTSDGQT
jgi:hypothetical protein